MFSGTGTVVRTPRNGAPDRRRRQTDETTTPNNAGRRDSGTQSATIGAADFTKVEQGDGQLNDQADDAQPKGGLPREKRRGTGWSTKSGPDVSLAQGAVQRIS